MPAVVSLVRASLSCAQAPRPSDSSAGTGVARLTILFNLGIGMLPADLLRTSARFSLYDFIHNLPSAAQGLVECDQGSGGVGLAPGEAVLGLEQGTLGIEHREKIRSAFLEALFCQPSRLFACFGRGPEVVAPRLLPPQFDQSVLGLLQRPEHRQLVLCDARLGARIGLTDAGAYPSEVQGGPADRRAKE